MRKSMIALLCAASLAVPASAQDGRGREPEFRGVQGVPERAERPQQREQRFERREQRSERRAERAADRQAAPVAAAQPTYVPPSRGLVARPQQRLIENRRAADEARRLPDGSIDRNNNGRIDRYYDRNRDGRLDRRYDRNADGSLDRRYDRNRDGELDRRLDRNNDERVDRRYDRDRDGRIDAGRYRNDWRYGDNRHDGYHDRRHDDDRRYGYDRRYRYDHRWDRGWRADRRYDWQGYRQSYRYIYRPGRYYAPYGYRHYGYNRFSIGLYLGSAFYASDYWLDDPYRYRLPPAYGPYRWVRYYDDVLLVDVRNGYVVDVIYDFFYR